MGTTGTMGIMFCYYEYYVLLNIMFCRILCSAEYYVLPNIMFCRILCSAEYYVLPNIMFCRILCSAEYYVLPNIMSCRILCPAEYYVLPNIMSCRILCPAEYYILPKIMSCRILCPAEYYVLPNIMSCRILCPAEYYVLPNIMSCRILCPAEYYVLPNIMSCRILCPAEYYVLPNIMSSRILCPAEYYVQPNIMSSRILCPAEYYVQPNIMFCRILCPAEYYVQPNIMSSRILCSAEYYVLPNITIETNKRTIAHKEEVISEQATAIISLKTDCEYNSTDGGGDIGNCNIKLAEANSAIEEKHNEVKNYPSQLQNAYQDNSKLTDKIGSLREILEEDKFNLSEQKKRLHEANVIREKTEMAYIAHIDTVAAKNQVIDHQKTIIDNQETVIDSLRNTTTNHTLVDTEAVPILNSFHNKNGVITDAVLIWIDIQRMTTAENIWKTQALSHFTTEEISTAKSEMWSRCGEQKLGKLIKRQGSSKTEAELDDMSAAFKSLAENDMLPLFIA